VVLHTVEIDTDKVREALAAAGLPNLWIPRIFRRVERIPVLGTGKMDLKAIAELARR
jgi:acyl-[acyl-carrier-protein]-phospholipid O-acyltransferase/long-chain-fatty-acid--[acyl-carrier-protein] ligase